MKENILRISFALILAAAPSLHAEFTGVGRKMGNPIGGPKAAPASVGTGNIAAPTGISGAPTLGTSLPNPELTPTAQNPTLPTAASPLTESAASGVNESKLNSRQPGSPSAKPSEPASYAQAQGGNPAAPVPATAKAQLGQMDLSPNQSGAIFDGTDQRFGLGAVHGLTVAAAPLQLQSEGYGGKCLGKPPA